MNSYPYLLASWLKATEPLFGQRVALLEILIPGIPRTEAESISAQSTEVLAEALNGVTERLALRGCIMGAMSHWQAQPYLEGPLAEDSGVWDRASHDSNQYMGNLHLPPYPVWECPRITLWEHLLNEG